jgi:NRAMP (natural resistance-associated macrophage protein)-like metal ion transporter
MAACFFTNFFSVHPDASAVLRGLFVPTIPSGSLPVAIGLVGSVIMPHNLYLHSSLVLSRKFDTTKKGLVKEANAYNAVESAGSLFISFMINFSVIGTFAYFSTLDTTYDLNLENAATALELTFGNAAKYIWAVGLLASG